MMAKMNTYLPLIDYWKRWDGSITCAHTRKTWTAREAIHLSDVLTEQFIEHGFTSGDTIGMALVNTVAFPAVMMALLSINCNPLLINASATSKEMRMISDKFHLKCIIHDDIKTVGGVDNRVIAENNSYRFRHKNVDLLYLAMRSSDNPVESMKFGNGVFLHPTSGTYGKSSYCIRSQAHNLCEAINYLSRIPFRRHGSVMALTPLHHAFAFGFGLICSILTDSNLILYPVFNPRIVLKKLRTEDVEILALVPPMLSSMVLIPEVSDYKMAQSVFYAGVPCPIALSEQFCTVFKSKLYQIYGTTETGAITSSYDKRNIYSGVGRCLQNVEVRILRDDSFDSLGANVGEILVKTNSLMDRYTHYTMRKSEFWHTGDLGFLDNSNNLHLTGRVKDIINVGGTKVDPTEVERVLREHAMVSDAVVYPYIRDDGKEMVQAAIVMRNTAVSDSELRAFCFENMSEYKVPVYFHFVESLPRTSSGKIRKVDLPNFPENITLPMGCLL